LRRLAAKDPSFISAFPISALPPRDSKKPTKVGTPSVRKSGLRNSENPPSSLRPFAASATSRFQSPRRLKSALHPPLLHFSFLLSQFQLYLMLSVSNTPSSSETELGELSFWQSLMIQKRVVGALLMREILTRYGRHNIGFMWLFAEPMVFTLGVTVLWNIMNHHSVDGISITAFVLTGYSTILLWRNMPSRCVMAINPNASLLFHRQVKPIDIYLSRTILEALGATISLIVLSILFIFMGLVDFPNDPLKVAGGWALLIWFALSISLFIGSLSERTDIVEKIWHPAMYLLVPLSGSFFTVESLPHGFSELILYNPTVSCTEIIREGFFGTNYHWHYDIGYTITFNLIFTMIGLNQVWLTSRKLALELS
jgi:capsular polysaccharide transport system permease protein